MAYDLAGARRAIFAECRAQGIDEDTRHAILREIGKVASGSATDLGADAARRVLEHLRKKSALAGRRGGQPANEWAFIDAAAAEKRPMLRKICAMCGALRVGKRYAEGVALRQFGIARRLEMMDAQELHGVTGALARTQKYRDKKDREHAPA